MSEENKIIKKNTFIEENLTMKDFLNENKIKKRQSVPLPKKKYDKNNNPENFGEKKEKKLPNNFIEDNQFFLKDQNNFLEILENKVKNWKVSSVKNTPQNTVIKILLI